MAIFSDFLEQISLLQSSLSDVSTKYNGITSVLNKKIRDKQSSTEFSLQVGSYGRKTAIRGISDLDMIYIMPIELKSKFSGENAQRDMLTYIKDILKETYTRTDIRVDRQIVSVPFVSYKIEVLPVFLNNDGTFIHADTYCGGTWCKTNPKDEIQSFNDMATQTGKCFRHLCKMVRAWKNTTGIAISGYLIDTLVYNFFKNNQSFYNTTFSDYPNLCYKFFLFLSQQQNKQYYWAPGSNSKVEVDIFFQKKALYALSCAKKAIEESTVHYWKEVFGKSFPSVIARREYFVTSSWDKTEEFIEDKFFVDIRYGIKIDCEVLQDGFRIHNLLNMLINRIPLHARKSLNFFVIESSVPKPYSVYWKVLNRGDEAERRNQIRGQILEDEGHQKRKERTSFKGEHLVECYAVKDNILVARDRIIVPIRSNIEEIEE